LFLGRGSLSENKLLFSNGKPTSSTKLHLFPHRAEPHVSLKTRPLLSSSAECNGILADSLRNASSSPGAGRAGGRGKSPSVRGMEPETWTADAADQNPWVQLELADKSKVTGESRHFIEYL